MSRTLHLFGTDWGAMMVPIQVIRWYRMQCYDGTDSCAIVVPIRRYCQMKAQVFFVPFPKAGDKYWQKQVPLAMRNDYIRLGNLYQKKPWNAIPNSMFAEFRTNGNRTRYEEASFGIRKQFVCLVMAEIMQGRGRFLPSIRKGLHYFIEKEPWWGIPAHYPKDHPEKDIQPVDLFNAETAGMLAWTLYMLEDEINRKEKGLCDQVRSEIDRRFLKPVLNQPQGWKNNANNWNTWITANWLQTVLICEPDAKLRDAAFKGVQQCLRTFMKGYPDDGGCEEGVSYWDCAGASFFESLYFMQFAPKQAVLTLNEAQKKKVENMGRFITTMYINDLTFVNFSDAQAQNVPNINILFPYGEFLQNEQMMQLAAYVGKKYQYSLKPSTLFLKSGNYPKLGRELMLLSMLPKYQATAAVEPKTEDAYLLNSQIMVASNKNWFVAAKGGNNAESHNHNDIGNFIVYHNNQPVVIDLGRDTYTSKSFSNQRFELMNCRSAYHNVPIINGLEQKDGRKYRAEKVNHVFADGVSSLSLNLEKAYTEGAHVEKWQRTIALDREYNWVEVTEQYKLDSLQIEKDRLNGQVFDNQIILMSYGKPVVQKAGRILLQGGLVRLEYDAQYLSASVEKVQMTDGIMKTQWKDNVYRIILRLNDNYPMAKVKYRFVNAK
ncbi:heparinase II/III family protein [Segatella sp.]|uniref:heparinase II/III domain-containing protein n=2 Tax=Segatella sp. TaxID=2974253 RepID=UPI00307AB037